MSLLIKNVAIADVLEDEIKTGDIYIRNGRFEKIAEHIDASEGASYGNQWGRAYCPAGIN